MCQNNNYSFENRNFPGVRDFCKEDLDNTLLSKRFMFRKLTHLHEHAENTEQLNYVPVMHFSLCHHEIL